MEHDPSIGQPDKEPDDEIRRRIVDAIYEECRANLDLYDSPSGIEVNIGDITWNVTYWPGWKDRDEWVGITRDSRAYLHPVSYLVHLSGEVTKVDTIKKRMPGGVLFDESKIKVVNEISEVDLLRAIIIAAHDAHK